MYQSQKVSQSYRRNHQFFMRKPFFTPRPFARSRRVESRAACASCAFRVFFSYLDDIARTESRRKPLPYRYPSLLNLAKNLDGQIQWRPSCLSCTYEHSSSSCGWVPSMLTLFELSKKLKNEIGYCSELSFFGCSVALSVPEFIEETLLRSVVDLHS